jgi:hypothetical protein
MAKAAIRNIAGVPITLPAPLSRLLAPGRTAVVDMTAAEAIDALGGAENVESILQVDDVPDANPVDLAESPDGVAEPRAGFVLRPGGTPGLNVYDDWPSLMAAVAAVDGPKSVLLDFGLLPPLTFFEPPLGTWDMDGVVLEGAGQPFATILALHDGVVFANFRAARNIAFAWDNTTAPINDDVADGDRLDFDNCVFIGLSNTEPFFDVAGVVPVAGVLARLRFTLVNSFFAAPWLRTDSDLTIAIHEGTRLGDAIVGPASGQTVSIDLLDSGGYFEADQTGFGGTIAPLTFGLWYVEPTSVAIGPFSAATLDIPSKLLRYDASAGTITQPLPSAAGRKSRTLVVVETSGLGDVELDPFPGQTVDGSTATFPVRGAGAILVADGSSDWAVVGYLLRKALPTGYIERLPVQALSAGDTVRVHAGRCRDSTDRSDIVLTASLDPDVTTSGANGLDTGVVANDTWYFVYVIADSTGVNPVAALFSTSYAAPTLPSGYDRFRRIGSARRGTGAFVPFTQGPVIQAPFTAGEGNLGSVRWVHYLDDEANRQVLAAGAAVVDTNIDLSDVVPFDTAVGAVTFVARFDLRAAVQDASFASGLPSNPSVAPELTVLAGNQVVADLLTNGVPQLRYINAGVGGITDVFCLGYQEVL